jgi:hypothetical protein
MEHLLAAITNARTTRLRVEARIQTLSFFLNIQKTCFVTSTKSLMNLIPRVKSFTGMVESSQILMVMQSASSGLQEIQKIMA